MEPEAFEERVRLPWSAAWGMAVLLAIFQVYAFRADLDATMPGDNDEVLHATCARFVYDLMRGEAAEGQDPLDPWIPHWSAGFPIMHHYQPLPWLTVASLGSVLRVEPESFFRVFAGVKLVLLALIPLSVVLGMRWMGWGPVAASAAAACAVFTADGHLFGLSHESFAMRGWGLFSQLWGTVLFMPVMGSLVDTVFRGRHLVRTGLLIAILVLCHAIFVYVAALTGVVLLAVGASTPRLSRFLRLAAAGGLAGIIASFYLVPNLWDLWAVNPRSVWVTAEKYDSIGFSKVLSFLVTGALFDAGRSIPLVSTLVLFGVVLAALRGPRLARIILVCFVVWLLLYAGRLTWGSLVDYLPLGRNLHMHRLIVAVHLFGWVLAGTAAARMPRTPLLCALLLSGICVSDRIDYAAEGARARAKTERAYTHELGKLEDLLSDVPRDDSVRLTAASEGPFEIGSSPVSHLLYSLGRPAIGFLHHVASFTTEIQLHFDPNEFRYFDLFNVGYIIMPAEDRTRAFFRKDRKVDRFARHRVEVHGPVSLVDVPFAWAGDAYYFYRANVRWVDSTLPEKLRYPMYLLKGPAPEGFAGPVFDLRQGPVYLERFEEPPFSPPGELVSVENEIGEHHVEVRAERDAYVLFRYSFHPGWRVHVDGVETEPVMLATGFLGVPVVAGLHRVDVRYAPHPVRTPLLILGFAAIPLAWLAERRGLFTRLGFTRPAK